MLRSIFSITLLYDVIVWHHQKMIIQSSQVERKQGALTNEGVVFLCHHFSLPHHRTIATSLQKVTNRVSFLISLRVGLVEDPTNILTPFVATTKTVRTTTYSSPKKYLPVVSTACRYETTLSQPVPPYLIVAGLTQQVSLQYRCV